MKYSDPDATCINCGFQGVTLHHIKHQGAGGTDEDFNLMPLCNTCHTEWHAIGIMTFTQKHSRARHWMKEHGWNLMLGKWFPPIKFPPSVDKV